MNKRAPATGSERQAKYRTSKQLGGVFLVEATRIAINALQVRMGLPKGAVVARAIDMLTKEMDRKELRRKRPAGGDDSAGAAGTVDNKAFSSLADKAASPALAQADVAQSGRTAPTADATLRRRLSKDARQAKSKGDSADLFDALIPRS